MRNVALLFVFVSKMIAQTVSVKPLDFSGLEVIRATDPAAQSIVASALSSNPPEIVNLLPYSVVLRNNTTHTISAYTLRLSFVNAAGKSGSQNRQYFNFESTSNGMEIPPGTARLITAVDSIAPGRGRSGTSGGPNPAELTKRLGSQVSVVVAVDLVVFDSGQVIGPDEGNTLSYLQGYLTGEREVASLVHTAFNKGASLREVSDQLEKKVKELETGGTGNRFEKLAHISQAKRLLSFAGHSQEGLRHEANRILAKPAFTLYR